MPEKETPGAVCGARGGGHLYFLSPTGNRKTEGGTRSAERVASPGRGNFQATGEEIICDLFPVGLKLSPQNF